MFLADPDIGDTELFCGMEAGVIYWQTNFDAFIVVHATGVQRQNRRIIIFLLCISENLKLLNDNFMFIFSAWSIQYCGK